MSNPSISNPKCTKPAPGELESINTKSIQCSSKHLDLHCHTGMNEETLHSNLRHLSSFRDQSSRGLSAGSTIRTLADPARSKRKESAASIDTGAYQKIQYSGNHQPSTPEAQIFDISDDAGSSNIPSRSKVPGLTPDSFSSPNEEASTPHQHKKAQSLGSMYTIDLTTSRGRERLMQKKSLTPTQPHLIPRKPVPTPEVLTGLPSIKPLRLSPGVPSNSPPVKRSGSRGRQNPIVDVAKCGWCKKSLNLRLEPYNRFECGHFAHKDCGNNASRDPNGCLDYLKSDCALCRNTEINTPSSRKDTNLPDLFTPGFVKGRSASAMGDLSCSSREMGSPLTDALQSIDSQEDWQDLKKRPEPLYGVKHPLRSSLTGQTSRSDFENTNTNMNVVWSGHGGLCLSRESSRSTVQSPGILSADSVTSRLSVSPRSTRPGPVQADSHRSYNAAKILSPSDFAVRRSNTASLGSVSSQGSSSFSHRSPSLELDFGENDFKSEFEREVITVDGTHNMVGAFLRTDEDENIKEFQDSESDNHNDGCGADDVSPSMFYNMVSSNNQLGETLMTDSKLTAYSLKILPAVKADIRKGKAKAVICFQIPKLPTRLFEFNSTYQNDALDVARSIEVKHMIQKCDLNDRHMSSVQTGILRICSVATVTSSGGSKVFFMNAEVLLFDNVFVIMTGERVVAALDNRAFLKGARTDAVNSNVLKVYFQADNIQDIDLHMKSQAEACAWEHAINNPTAQFPTDQGNWETYLVNLEKKIASMDKNFGSATERLPAELVICIPLRVLAKNLKLKKCLISTFSKHLKSNDLVSFIVYSSTGKVESSVSMKSPHWNGWKDFFDFFSSKRSSDFSSPSAYDINESASATRGTSPNTYPSVCTAVPKGRSQQHIDTLLYEAKNMLHMKYSREGTASIIFVAEDAINLGSSLSIFHDSDIPVCTIAMGPRSDPISLTTLASRTGGSYHYCNDLEELSQSLILLVKRECEYVFRELVVRIRPRIGAKITNVMRNPRDFRPISLGAIANEPLEIKLGSMRVGDFKSIIVELSGEILASQPLFQTSFETYKFSEMGEENVRLRTVRVMTPAEQDNANLSLSSLMIDFETIMGTAFETLCESLSNLMDDSNEKSTANILRLRLAEISDMINFVVTTRGHFSQMKTILRVLNQDMNQLCEDIVQQKRPDELIRKILDYMWLIDRRKTLLKRSPLELIFY